MPEHINQKAHLCGFLPVTSRFKLKTDRAQCLCHAKWVLEELKAFQSHNGWWLGSYKPVALTGMNEVDPFTMVSAYLRAP